MQLQLEGRQFDMARHHVLHRCLASVEAQPGIGHVGIVDVCDGAIALAGIDVVPEGADIASVRSLFNARRAHLVEPGVVVRHVACGAENGAHLTAAGGAAGDDFLLVAGDLVPVEPQEANAGLLVHAGGGRLAHPGQVPAPGAHGDIHKAVFDAVGVLIAGGAGFPARAAVLEHNGGGPSGVAVADARLVDGAVGVQIGRRYKDIHVLVFLALDVGHIVHKAQLIALAAFAQLPLILILVPFQGHVLEIQVRQHHGLAHGRHTGAAGAARSTHGRHTGHRAVLMIVHINPSFPQQIVSQLLWSFWQKTILKSIVPV